MTGLATQHVVTFALISEYFEKAWEPGRMQPVEIISHVLSPTFTHPLLGGTRYGTTVICLFAKHLLRPS